MSALRLYFNYIVNYWITEKATRLLTEKVAYYASQVTERSDRANSHAWTWIKIMKRTRGSHIYYSHFHTQRKREIYTLTYTRATPLVVIIKLLKNDNLKTGRRILYGFYCAIISALPVAWAVIINICPMTGIGRSCH